MICIQLDAPASLSVSMYVCTYIYIIYIFVYIYSSSTVYTRVLIYAFMHLVTNNEPPQCVFCRFCNNVHINKKICLCLNLFMDGFKVKPTGNHRCSMLFP